MVTEALDKPRVVKFKGALDLVTETDEASEKAILEVDTSTPHTECPPITDQQSVQPTN